MGLLCLALETAYLAKNTTKFADQMLIPFLWEETNRAGCGSSCGTELFVLRRQPSEVYQTTCLFHRVTKLFVDLRCFFRLLYLFLVEVALTD